jgi:hypothetical protein
VDKVALGRGSSEYFGFACQSLFHQLLYTHLSYDAIGELATDVLKELGLTLTHVKNVATEKLPIIFNISNRNLSAVVSIHDQ